MWEMCLKFEAGFIQNSDTKNDQLTQISGHRASIAHRRQQAFPTLGKGRTVE
jgi:hypothetical protein